MDYQTAKYVLENLENWKAGIVAGIGPDPAKNIMDAAHAVLEHYEALNKEHVEMLNEKDDIIDKITWELGQTRKKLEELEEKQALADEPKPYLTKLDGIAQQIWDLNRRTGIPMQGMMDSIKQQLLDWCDPEDE